MERLEYEVFLHSILTKIYQHVLYYAFIVTGIVMFRRISNLFTPIGEIQVYVQNEFYQLLKTMELLEKFRYSWNHIIALVMDQKLIKHVSILSSPIQKLILLAIKVVNIAHFRTLAI